MKKYLVGGAVRDKLLNIPINDKDYVVVGSSREEMIQLGFKEVGNDFPVFLDDSGEEFALARIERNTGDKYTDFSFSTKDVTLEEDLSRRDLTINSIAMDTDSNEIIDPFKGQEDIQKKILRHTSEAFQEDPLRVLRLARMKARFGLEWSIHPSTKALVYSMRDKLHSLTRERVWMEVEKTLKLDTPSLFFKTLLEMNVLDVVFPSIFELVTCSENSKWHSEPSVFIHSMNMLDNAPKDTTIQLACVYHDIAKPPMRRLNGHSGGHDDIEYIEENGLISLFIPGKVRKDVLFLISNHIRLNMLDELTPKKIVKFLFQYIKKEDLLQKQFELSDLDQIHVTSLVPRFVVQRDKILQMFKIVKEVKLTKEEYERYSGEQIKLELHSKRCYGIKFFLRENKI